MQKRNKVVQYAIGELKRYQKSLKTDFKHQNIIIGVSGGADSLALACIASIAYSQYNIKVVIIDHGLQNNSDIVAKNAGNEVSKLGLEYIIKHAIITKSTNLEAVAREERYRLLLDECIAGDILMLAHTIDDLAETVLLNIARGSGTHALTGMSDIVRLEGDIIIARPFLHGITRDMTEEICDVFNLHFWNDPTNFIDNTSILPTPKRTSVRHKLLPLYNELFPGIKQNLSRTALISALDDEYINNCMMETYNSVIMSDNSLDRLKLKEYHKALRYRVIKHWLIKCGYAKQIIYDRIFEIDEKLILINGVGGTVVELEDGFRVDRDGIKLTLNSA